MSEFLLLLLDLFLSDCAQIKEAKKVDLDELVIVKLLKSILKLSLLSAQIGPQRVFKLCLKLLLVLD